MGTITLGVVADTHVPDRASALRPRLLSYFKERQVGAILHAGDVCVPSVLSELETIAPVYAVRGNRDIYYLRHLPTQRELVLNGVTISLVHGHGNLHNYLIDRLTYQLRGLEINHFQKRVQEIFPNSKVIVYGHIHYPIQRWIDKQMIFNPGSACCPDKSGSSPSAGLITLDDSGGIQGEIFYLD